jgi:hypothetical protein
LTVGQTFNYSTLYLKLYPAYGYQLANQLFVQFTKHFIHQGNAVLNRTAFSGMTAAEVQLRFVAKGMLMGGLPVIYFTTT